MHLKSKIKQCPMVWTALGDTGTKLPTQQKIPTLRYRCSDLPAFCLWTLKVSLTLCPFKYVVSTVTCKGFNTFITITGLLSTMCSLMYLEMTVICKGFLTSITFLRFLSCTVFCMFGDNCGLERVYFIHYIHAGFLPYVFFYVWGDDCVTQGISTLEKWKELLF